MPILDLSRRIEAGMSVFPGDPGVALDEMATYEKDGCKVTEFCFGSHTGTHLDAPCHFLPGGKSVTDFPLEYFTGDAICLAPTLTYGGADENPVMDLSPEDRARVISGMHVLLSSGWESRAGTDAFYRGYPVFAKDLVDFLLEKRVRLLGLDLPTVQEVGDADPSPMHRRILAHDLLPVEGLTGISALVGKTFRFTAMPLPVFGSDGSPVRAYAEL